jgi:hypothetical protein
MTAKVILIAAVATEAPRSVVEHGADPMKALVAEPKRAADPHHLEHQFRRAVGASAEALRAPVKDRGLCTTSVRAAMLRATAWPSAKLR